MTTTVTASNAAPPLDPIAKSPRTRKPVCGILAWVLPLSAILVGYLFLRLCDRKGGEVFALLIPPAWGLIPLLVALCMSPTVRKSPLRILALLLPPPAIFGLMMMTGGNSNSGSGFGGLIYVVLMILPLVIGLCASPILAIVSLLRRERYPGLAVAVLILYGIALFWYGLVEAYDKFGEVGALVMIIVPGVLFATGLVWRFGRQRAAAVECPGGRIQTKAEDGDISGSAPVSAKTPRKVQMPFGLALGILSIVYSLFVWAMGIAAWSDSGYGGEKPFEVMLLLFGGIGAIVQLVLSAIVTIRSLKKQVSILSRWPPLKSLIFCHLGLLSSLLALFLALSPVASEVVGYYVRLLLLPYVVILLIMICLRRKWFFAASEGKGPPSTDRIAPVNKGVG